MYSAGAGSCVSFESVKTSTAQYQYFSVSYWRHWKKENIHNQYCYNILNVPAHLQLPPRSVPELNVPENKTPHLIEVHQMDAEFNQTVCGRWPATGPLGLGVPKIKALHQKQKFGVQHDSLEAGAAVKQPPLQLRGNLMFSFLSFFLSFLHLAFIWPRYWLRLRPGTGLLFSFLNLAFVWPRYWPLIGPGAGLLTSFLNLAFIWPRYWSSFFFLEFCFYPAQE